MRPGDPRIRQTINQISQNLESANESAQEGIYTFSHNYIGPCFSGIRDCLNACTSPCFPRRDDQLRRRKRGRSSGRAEYIFDFYDDWDYDEDLTGDGILGWGNDELDRLLAGGSGGRGSSDQPRKNRRMSYGARGGRRKGSILPHDERQDPTVIPSSSFLGFLERFPWRIGARGIRYRPSAADLQVNPGGGHKHNVVPENEPLLEASDESETGSFTKQGRKRSGTESSRETCNSLSSRGDLIPSDEEEDAVPLDDELTMVLARRGTSFGPEDPSLPRRSTHSSLKDTPPSRESKDTGTGKGKGKGRGKRNKAGRRSTTTSKSSHSATEVGILESSDFATIADLKKEEEDARLEEEREVERRRLAAQKLARNRGLSINDDDAQTPHSLTNSDPPNDENEPPPDHLNRTADDDAPVMSSESNDPNAELRLNPPDDQDQES